VANQAKKPTNRICMHCGEQLPQRMRSDAIFCSAECNYHAHALQRKLRARTGEEGKPGYLRAFICDRDRWRCGICGKSVSKTRIHPDPLCASLDHVTPVSQGGTNDLWNLRLTHLRCNLVRGNRGDEEQLAML
jgi:5-methylcytosine-specific restriction endonuclease McrA